MAEETKLLGRIVKARFGFGGRDDAMFGLSVEFAMPGGGVGDFKGAWSAAPGEHAKWTAADQHREWLSAMTTLLDTLADAKKRDGADLAGTPVELTFEGSGLAGSRLKSWRVLTEVIG